MTIIRKPETWNPPLLPCFVYIQPSYCTKGSLYLMMQLLNLLTPPPPTTLQHQGYKYKEGGLNIELPRCLFFSLLSYMEQMINELNLTYCRQASYSSTETQRNSQATWEISSIFRVGFLVEDMVKTPPSEHSLSLANHRLAPLEQNVDPNPLKLSHHFLTPRIEKFQTHPHLVK